MKHLYFDYAAAAPLDPRVWRAMRRVYTSSFANPSSGHAFGREARAVVDSSRSKCAEIFGCTPREIFFTHSGTEANNLALLGLARAHQKRGKHVLVSSIEHESVRQTARALAQEGFSVSEIPVDGEGRILVDSLSKLLRTDTVLVSFVLGNNEIGVVQDLPLLQKIFHDAYPDILLHVDACQYAPFFSMRVADWGVSAMTCNSSKMCGPKGVGVLYVREDVSIAPVIYGGGQEYGLWPGTENVPALVGFAEALQYVQKHFSSERRRIAALRDEFFAGVQKFFPAVMRSGSVQYSLPHILHLIFPGFDTETVLIALDQVGICASSGSACRSGSIESSPVLAALGRSSSDGASVRFSFGRFTTRAEIQEGLRRTQRVFAALHRK